MTNSDRPIPIEELLDYAPQLQQLAGRLAAEWDRDDVVQETWLRVLEQPPRHRRNLASWLSGALRMRSADHYRRETSQRQRVARAADRGAKTRDSSTTPEELEAELPYHMKRTLAQKKASLYVIDGAKIGIEVRILQLFE